MQLYASQHQSFPNTFFNSDNCNPKNGNYHNYSNNSANPNLCPWYQPWCGRTNHQSQRTHSSRSPQPTQHCSLLCSPWGWRRQWRRREGSGRGGGPPPGQPAPTGQGQAAVPAAADIKVMGNLPHKFTGDRTKADDFIEEVKAYFCINEDVAGFNLSIKKVTFTLTLIKGDEVARWVRDMGIWIDRLNQVQDNFPIIWT